MLRLDRFIYMKYIYIFFFLNIYIFFFSNKVAGANVRVGGQMRRAPACFDTPAVLSE